MLFLSLKTEGSRIFHRQPTSSSFDVLSYGDFGFLSWRYQEKTEQNSDFELLDTNERSMPGWAINLHHQLLGERERNAEPPGELRKGYLVQSLDQQGALALTEHELLAAVVVRKTPVRLLFGCLEFVLVAQPLLDGHNTRDVGQGYTDALPFRGGRCTGAVSQLSPRVATPVSS